MDFSKLRIGIGHDTHRLQAGGGPLILGGIQVEAAVSLVGHSDADVLLHAVTDALLGASGKGDIGEWFPDTDPALRGKDSSEMLAAVVRELTGERFQILHVDCILFAESPKLSPYKPAIAARLGELLNLPVERVGVKAKTGEKVGPVGRGEAMSAQCVALLVHDP